MSKLKPRTVKINSSITVLPAGIEPTLLRCCNTPLTTELGRYSTRPCSRLSLAPSPNFSSFYFGFITVSALYCNKTKMKPGKVGTWNKSSTVAEQSNFNYPTLSEVRQNHNCKIITGVPKKTIHCLISCNVKSIKAISLK